MATPPMFFMPPAPGPTPPHNHLVCGGCTTLLMYPQGAANVRCSRCGHITGAPPTTGTDTAQLVCNGCRVLLSFPRGASSVQCSICHTITQVPTYEHLVCNGCSIMLMYPVGAQSIKCSVCHSVTPATASISNHPGSSGAGTSGTGGSSGAGPSGSGAAQPPPVRAVPKIPGQAVVIENPPTLDEQGNEVANIAVGIKSDAQ